jgi:FkbM family methyltransferase
VKLRRAKIGEKINFFYLENDRYIGQRAAVGKYEPYETQLILRQAKVGGTVIDVGANIGYYTLILADKVGKNGKVYAFEPDKINFEILEKNIKENKLKNVVAIKAAIGSKNESKILYKSEENLGDHKLYKPKTPAKKREKVKIVRLDSFIKEKMDLIKIDTQGWEPEVIEGAK